MTIQQITPLPTPPTRADYTTFNERADAFLTALPTFVTQTNTLASELDAASIAAVAAAGSAIQSADVTAWVSGTTYAVGVCVYDPVSFLTYRRKIAGAGTTRPALDSTNWQLITGQGNVNLESTQSFTGVNTFTQTIVGNISGNAASVSDGVITSSKLSASGVSLPSGSTAVTQSVGDNSTKIATTAFVAANQKGLGIGQTWQSPARSESVIYTNTTGNPIFVSVSSYLANGTISLYVNNVIVSISRMNGWGSVSVAGIVGNNDSYKVSVVLDDVGGGGGSSLAWKELR